MTAKPCLICGGFRDFVAAVARGRGVTTAVVQEQFGQGRMYDATEAVRRRMVDRVGTFDQAVAQTSARGASFQEHRRQALNAQRQADLDYIDTGIKIAQRR